MKAESPGALVRSILSSRLEAQGFYAQGFIGAHAFNSLLGETGVPAGLRKPLAIRLNPPSLASPSPASPGPTGTPRSIGVFYWR